jgi:DNA-binding NarL/FixJ family response regulator
MTEVIRVVIADDQRVVREGLASLLSLLDGVEVAGAASDGDEVVELARTLHPDVVLMDLRMPRSDGVQAARRLQELAPNVRVLVLTTYADDRSVIDALRAGARGYLTKDAGAEEIHAALRQVMRGQAAVDPAVQHHLIEAIVARPEVSKPATPRLPDGLTVREGEVLGLIAQGLSNHQIAEHLRLSETTIKTHVNHIFAKTAVRDRAQAVTYAYRNGFAPPARASTVSASADGSLEKPSALPPDGG